MIPMVWLVPAPADCRTVPKSESFHASPNSQHIARLQVPMDQFLLVQERQRRRDVPCEDNRFLGSQPRLL